MKPLGRIIFVTEKYHFLPLEMIHHVFFYVPPPGSMTIRERLRVLEYSGDLHRREHKITFLTYVFGRGIKIVLNKIRGRGE